jgi:hypothetical protein
LVAAGIAVFGAGLLHAAKKAGSAIASIAAFVLLIVMVVVL